MPQVDCETLLLPLPGDSPVGDESYFAMTLAPALRELRREESADEFDDATRPAQLKKADWVEIARLCEESLCNQAKDLRTACHLIEAKTRLEGLAGLRDGLETLARLVDECWDRILPELGDDPVETRGVPLGNLLDDPDRGVCFPNLIKTFPLIGVDENARSFTAWTRLRAGGDVDTTAELNHLREQTPPEGFKQDHTDATAALYWLDSLRSSLDNQLGEAAPGLLKLRAAITDLIGLLEEELTRLGFTTDGSAVAIKADDNQESLPSPTKLGVPERDELYTLLDETAERLRRMEPHSPIPYMIKRAVRLGRLPFPSLMQQVIREPSALSELNREFGIAEPEGSEVLA